MADTNQNASQTEQQKQLTAEANLRKLIAEAREAEAKADKQFTDAQKAARDAEREAWKGPDVKALEGKLTANGNFIETRILAYKCLTDLINLLVEEMNNNSSFKGEEITFVIYNAADLPAIELYLATMDQLSELQSIIKDNIKAATTVLEKSSQQNAAGGSVTPLSVGFAAAGILRTAADIFSLLKTNTTFINYDIGTDEELIVSCFADAVKKTKHNWKIFYPAFYPVHAINQGSENSAFTKLFMEVKIHSNNANDLQKRIKDELEQIEQKLQSEIDLPDRRPLEVRMQELNMALSSLQSSLEAFLQLELMLLAIDQNTRVSTRALVMRAERLVTILKESTTYILKLTACLSGSSQVKENLFRSTKVLHSGGTQLSCLIFDQKGNIHFSDNRCAYSPYMESSEMSNTSSASDKKLV
ncbi:hypothetical protein [Telluribacter sp. SYSU D00476]|uniref:hypothetical protein n=1 Tax=Telluribacter sp. SYSU D00476 TaxID=2811430 RepID=UPI001FF5A001|nr:hypothetical protein [Telluribacter sp. SYSU D00476]